MSAGHEPTYMELLSTHDGRCEFRVRGMRGSMHGSRLGIPSVFRLIGVISVRKRPESDITVTPSIHVWDNIDQTL